jgi:hypothetical protein
VASAAIWNSGDHPNNIYGSLTDTPLDVLAGTFVRAGWRARKSSWTAYEIGCEWAEIEMFVHDGEARVRRVSSESMRCQVIDVHGSWPT